MQKNIGLVYMLGELNNIEKWQVQAVRALYSSSSILFLSVIPPGAENPPSFPSLRIIRWQGIISGSGFLASVLPTARLALGRPDFFANRP